MLAFLVPLAVRMIPELIAWPYPLGFDTLGYYIPAMRWWINPFSGQSLPTDALGIVRSAGLFYVISVAFNRFVVTDPFIAVKMLGPLLTGFVSLSVYSYGRLALGWNPWKALLAALIATLYFVGLRISWELYRNMLGVVFLFAALAALDVLSGVRRYILVTVLTLLVFVSHQITGVILLGVFVLDALWLLAKRRLRQVGSQVYFSALALCLLLFQLRSPDIGRLTVSAIGPPAGSETGTYMLGFPVYCFLFLLPLVIPGLRLRKPNSLKWWSLSCLLVLLVALAGWKAIPLWFRWPLMLVYPLSFYFTEGFERAVRFRHWHSPSGFAVRASAIGLVGLIILTSGFYLIAYPEHPFPYFSQYNPYLRYVQSSMLQNSVSTRDVPSLLEAIDAAVPLLGGGTVLVLHEAVYVWALNRLGPETRMVPVKEPGYASTNPQGASNAIEKIAFLNYDSGYRVYTIWWTSGSGWYTMPELPRTFKLIENTGTFGVYLFNPA